LNLSGSTQSVHELGRLKDCMPGECTLGSAIFPFLKLNRRSSCCRSTGWEPRSFGHIVCSLMSAWLLGLFFLLFLFQSISSLSKDEDAAGDCISKRRNTMHSMMLSFAREVLLLYLLHRLCDDLTEPQQYLQDSSTDDLNLIGEPGVITWIRQQTCKALGYQYSPKWITTFVADHIILMLTGLGYIGSQLSMASLILSANTSHSPPCSEGMPVVIVAKSISASYIAVLIVGFVWHLLPCTIVPRKDKGVNFCIATFFLILLWVCEFFRLLYARKMYTVSWRANTLQRVLAALGQIFVSHSTVMMGAILLGHSAHFIRSPDISWRMLLRCILPTLTLVMAMAVWQSMRRSVRLFPDCYPRYYSFAMAWPWFHTCLRIFGGVVLLAFVFLGGSKQHDEQARLSIIMRMDTSSGHSLIASLFDYDSALVFFTTCMALVWDLVHMFEGRWFTRSAHALGIAGPTGLALFTMNAWRRPQRVMMGRHAQRLGWFALFSALTWLVTFEEMEDCHISSSAPMCCSHPWLERDVHLDGECNFDERCKHKYSEKDLYCPPPPEGHQVSGEEAKTDAQQCDVTHDRQKNWAMDSMAKREAHHHHEQVPGALAFFDMVGTALSIEMYVTTVGVLLKVLMLSGGELSLEVMRLNARDKHHRHTVVQHALHVRSSQGSDDAGPVGIELSVRSDFDAASAESG